MEPKSEGTPPPFGKIPNFFFFFFLNPSLRIFKCPGASPMVTELNIQKKFWIFKFEYPNILKDIQVSWGISQCHWVEYPENSEYPEIIEDIQIQISEYP